MIMQSRSAQPQINVVHRFDASAMLMPRIVLHSNRMPSIWDYLERAGANFEI
jgi:hypothetical protein